jgi:hypothetical protein
MRKINQKILKALYFVPLVMVIFLEGFCFVGYGLCSWSQLTSQENLQKAVYMIPLILLVVWAIRKSGGSDNKEVLTTEKQLTKARADAEAAAKDWKSKR